MLLCMALAGKRTKTEDIEMAALEKVVVELEAGRAARDVRVSQCASVTAIV